MDKQVNNSESNLEILNNSDELSNDNLYKILKESVTSGENKLMQVLCREDLEIDDSWILAVEKYIVSLEKIVFHPSTFIKDERELVTVEKARTADAVALRHLATHTEYLKRVDEQGRIEPKKVLTKNIQDELAIYENKVVYSLLKRVSIFIDQRYENIKKILASYETTKMLLQSNFDVGSAKVSYRLDMEIRQKKKRAKADEILPRLTEIKTRIRALLNTPFAKALKDCKLINPPITRTNLLTKNADYRNAYELWLFISSFRTVGYSVVSADKTLPVDRDYYDDLTDIIVKTLKAVVDNNYIRKEQYDKLLFKDKPVRSYKLIKNVDINPSDVYRKILPNEASVNQYYYEKMKALVKKTSEKSSAGDVVDTVGVNINFKRYYKSIAKMNYAIFTDMMKLQSEKKAVKPKHATKKLNSICADLQVRRETQSKLRLLYELKAEELQSLEKKRETYDERLKILEAKYKAEVVKEEKRIAAQQRAKEKARLVRAARKERERLARERAKAKAAAIKAREAKKKISGDKHKV